MPRMHVEKSIVLRAQFEGLVRAAKGAGSRESSRTNIWRHLVLELDILVSVAAPSALTIRTCCRLLARNLRRGCE
jgi:hypothetical protein